MTVVQQTVIIVDVLTVLHLLLLIILLVAQIVNTMTATARHA